MTSAPNRYLTVAICFACLATVLRAEDKTPVKVKRDLVFAEVAGQKLKLDLHIPSTEEKPPVVVWIHGGGWRGGSRGVQRLSGITEHGFAIACISYRFTDKAVFPAQIHDCKAAVRWLRANADRFGYNADWIAVAGSSAGGHLALLLGTSGRIAELEGDVGDNLEHSSRVQAVIDYFGPSDFVLRGKTQPERAYSNKSGSYALLGGKDGNLAPAMERFASPATYVSADDPPLLIFQGTADKTVLPDQSERIAKLYADARLDVQLVMIEGAQHGGMRFFQGEHFDQAVHFLNTHKPTRSNDASSIFEADRSAAVLVAAHRGGYASDSANRAPENSIANLKLAIEKGYDVYETDIQRTADGVFVIMHDATIDRETTGTGAVSELTLSELKTLSKRYRDGSVSKEPVATLKELLTVGKGKILFKPDLKPGTLEHFDELAALILDLQMTDQVFLRTGFSDADAIADCFGNGCPHVEVMFKTKNTAQAKAVIDRFQPKTIQIDLAKGEAISDAKVEAIRYAVHQGVLVETHVYNDPDRWEKLAKLGVRMFHTNDPDRTLKFLRDNEWRKVSRNPK